MVTGRALRCWLPLLLSLFIIASGVIPTSSGVMASPDEMAAFAAGPNERLGFVFVNGVEEALGRETPAETWYAQATGAGATWNRWPIYWHKMEKTHGQIRYDDPAYNVDAVVEQDIKYGLRTNAILIGTPDWATAGTGLFVDSYPRMPFDVSWKPLGPPPAGALEAASPAAVPPGLNQPIFRSDGSINPDNTWATFVYHTVNRYKPGGELARARGWMDGQGIRVWELWNEPDNVYPRFWLGTPAEYARLLKVGAIAARTADPGATILFAGLAYWSNPNYLRAVLDHIVTDPEASAYHHYFDVVPLHLYVDPWHVYRITPLIRNELTRRGLGHKAIWVNETNAPIWGDSTPFGFGAWRATVEEQANFAIQVQALALAAGIERLFLFQLYEDGEVVYGFFRRNGTPRPAYAAAQVASTYLNGGSFAGMTHQGTVVSIVAMVPGKGRVTIVWNTSTAPTVAEIDARTPWATLVTRTGAASHITALYNRYTLTLGAGADHVYDAGSRKVTWHADGEPIILVEPVYSLLSSRVLPLPAVSSARSFVVQWERLDSQTEPAWYDVQYRAGDGPWTDWIIGQPLTSARFGEGYPIHLQPNTVYRFRVRARLDAQTEAWPEPVLEGDTNTRTAAHQLAFPSVRRGMVIGW